MKKIISVSISLLLIFTLLCGCGTQKADGGIWDSAQYVEDTTLGSGIKTVTVEVAAEQKSVKFIIKTDKTTVGEALLEQNLIEGENSAYGLYIKKVNGMLANYDVDQTYWAFYINGEYAVSGVDTTDIDENAVYKLERTK